MLQFATCVGFLVVFLFSMLQAEAELEVEKQKKLAEKKDAKEQKLKDQEDKKKQKAADKAAKEEAKKQKAANKEAKRIEKEKKAAEKAAAKAAATNKTKQGSAEDKKMEDQGEADSADAMPSPGSPAPATPKRKVHQIVATPRQKQMVKRQRIRVAADQGTAAGSKEDGKEDGKEGGDEKKHALQKKVAEAYQQLKAVHEIAADIDYFPALEEGAPSFKSFTARPYGGGEGTSIGCMLYRCSFYVYKAKFPEGLHEILQSKGVTTKVVADSQKGCSLGWTRFKSIKQANLSWFHTVFCMLDFARNSCLSKFVAKPVIPYGQCII